MEEQNTFQRPKSIYQSLLDTMIRYEALLEDQEKTITNHEDTIQRLLKRIRDLNKELRTQKLIIKCLFKDMNHICEEDCLCRN